MDSLGVTDSFKLHGMSSIAAMRLTMLLSRRGFAVTLSQILKADNVSKLCAIINDGIDNSDVGYWLMPYDETKPVVVLCCGIISGNVITSHMRDWTETYNIYVLKPIFDAWTDIEQISYDEILHRYETLMAGDIHSNIKCIMGFSFGGELAYRLTLLWYTRSGDMPDVIMGDTVITSLSSKHRVAYEDAYEVYYYQLQGEFFKKLGTLPWQSYNGRVTLVSAVGDDASRDANKQKWREIVNDIEILHVDDTHQGLYENAEHYTKYKSLIEF